MSDRILNTKESLCKELFDFLIGKGYKQNNK